MATAQPRQKSVSYLAVIVDDLSNKLHLPINSIYGVLGNFSVETGGSFDPNSLGRNDGGPGVDAIGIAQWEGTRRDALQAMARQMHGKETDLNVQLAYFNQEIAQRGQLSLLMNPNLSVDQATTIVQSQYEVSANSNLPQRIIAAEALAKPGALGHAILNSVKIKLPGLSGPMNPDTGLPAVPGAVGNAIANAVPGFKTVDQLVQTMGKTEFWIRVGFIVLGFVLVLIAIDKLTNGGITQAPSELPSIPAEVPAERAPSKGSPSVGGKVKATVKDTAEVPE